MDNYYCLCQHRGSEHAVENGMCWKCLCTGFNLDNLRYVEMRERENNTKDL